MQSLHFSSLPIDLVPKLFWYILVEQQLDEPGHIVFDVLVYLSLNLTRS